MRKIKIGNKLVGEGEPPFVIAEVGCNHENDMKMAKKMIYEAAKAGADAVKFQLFTAEKLVTRDAPAFWSYEPQQKPDYVIEGTQFEEYKAINQLTKKDYALLSQESKKNNIIFLATPFDKESADFLEGLNVPAYKIASGDLTNIPLIKYIANKGKPMIISTGAATIGEIEDTVNTIKNKGNKDIILLHCVIKYPTSNKDANLRMMVHLQNTFPNIPVGYSDHTIPDSSVTIPTVAVALGAKVIEKHFTLDKTIPGNDHFLSADPIDLTRMINNFKILEESLGSYFKKPLESEQKSRIFARRSIVSAADIPKGTIITEDMITTKRPGTGIAPKFINLVVGRKAKSNVKNDTIITFDMI